MELIDYHSCSNLDPTAVGYYTSNGYHTAVRMPERVIIQNDILQNAEELQKTECWNSDDCNRNNTDEAWFCNHDNDVFGFCENCNTVWKQCWNEEFLCERGEKSCNESCKRKQNRHS